MGSSVVCIIHQSLFLLVIGNHCSYCLKFYFQNLCEVDYCHLFLCFKVTLHESYLIIIISVLIAITTVVHCFNTVFLFFFSLQTKFPKSNNCVLGSLLFFWSHLSGCQLHKLVIQTRKSMVNHSKKKKHVIVFSNSTNSCSCFCFTFSVVRVIMAQIKNTVKLRNTQSYTHGKQGWVEGKATSSFVFFIILPFSKKWI